MRTNQLVAVTILIMLVSSFFLVDFPFNVNAQTVPDVYVGVDVAYADMPAIKKLIDEVSAYTNILVIGSSGITYDVTKLNEMCQYTYDRNMSFIIFTSNPMYPPE